LFEKSKITNDMTFLEKLQVIERVDGLIKRKATGTADELAERLGVSRSTVFEIINCMKAMGAEIEYNTSRQSYFYTVDKELSIGFVHSGQIIGGKSYNFFLQFEFFGLSYAIFELSLDK